MNEIREQIEQLNTVYSESCYPTHTHISGEPEYTCEYCNHTDVAPSHTEHCLAVECVLAADTMEKLLAVYEAARDVYRYCVVEPNSCHVSRNRMQDLQDALSTVQTRRECNCGEDASCDVCDPHDDFDDSSQK